MKKYLLFAGILFILPLISFAQAKYTPLVNVPGITDGGGKGFSVYINFLYAASISIAALLAVIKIIIAGIKYMMTDAIGTKSNAKGEIQGALLGLLLILGAYIILYIINPRLVNPTVEFQAIPTTPSSGTVPTTPQAPIKTVPGAVPPATPPAPTPSGQPPVVNSCNHTITSKVTGAITLFSLDLTGCSKPEISIYRKSLEDHCKSYNVFASGTPTKLSCGVATSKIK